MLREQAVQYILENPFFEGQDGGVNVQDYLENEDLLEWAENMKKDGVFADNIVISGTARLLGHNFLIVTSSPQSSIDNCLLEMVGIENFNEDHILLGHIYENHYQSLKPIDDTTLLKGVYTMKENVALSNFPITSEHGPQQPPRRLEELQRKEESLGTESDDSEDGVLTVCKKCKEVFNTRSECDEHPCRMNRKRKKKKDDQVKITYQDSQGRFKERIITDYDELDTDDFIHVMIERGSLVFWTKVDKSVANNRKKLVENVDRLTVNIMNKIPLKADEGETKFSVTLEVLDSSDDDDVTYICKKCRKDFSSMSSYREHRKECRKTSIGKMLNQANPAPDQDLKPQGVEPIKLTRTFEQEMDESPTIGVTSQSVKMLVTGTENKDFRYDSSTTSGYDTGSGGEHKWNKDQNRKRQQISMLSEREIEASNSDEIKTSLKNAVTEKLEHLDTGVSSGYETGTGVGLDQDRSFCSGEESVKRRKGTSARGRRKKQSRRDSRTKSEENVPDIDIKLADEDDYRYLKEQLYETDSFDSDSDDDLASPLESSVVKFADKEGLGFKKILTDYFEKSRTLAKTNARKALKDTSMSQSGLKLTNKCLRDLSSLSIVRGKKYKNYYKRLTMNVQELDNICQQDDMTRRGRLQIESSHEAKVKLEEPYHGNDEVTISGRSKCGKAFTDDIVVVRIYEPTGHTTHINRLKKDISTNLYGEVIGIIKRNLYEGVDHPVFICELDKYEYDKAKPICKTIPKLHLLSERRDRDERAINEPRPFTVDVFCYNEDRKIITFKESIPISPAVRSQYLFYVAYISWNGLYPLGAIIKVHDATKKFVHGLNILELRYKVPTLYRPETVRCVDNSNIDMAFENNKRGRIDLTDCYKIFTIDPRESTVLDDAVNVKQLPDGGFVVGVHITDVTPFIPKGSPLDEEIFERGTTFFRSTFGNPHQMIPEIISTKRCSLVPKQKRLTLSVLFHFDETLQFIQQDTKFCKSIIMSSYQMSYAEAQDIIQNKKESDFTHDVLMLYEISKVLRQKRLGYGSYFIPTEYSFSNDDETTTKYPEAYHLIEELMVLTNHFVAKFLLSKFPESLPLRCQNPPQDSKLKEWMDAYPKFADVILCVQSYPKRFGSRTFLNIDNISMPALDTSTESTGRKINANDRSSFSNAGYSRQYPEEAADSSTTFIEEHGDSWASKGEGSDLSVLKGHIDDHSSSKVEGGSIHALTKEGVGFSSSENRIVLRCSDIIFIQKWLWEAVEACRKSDPWYAAHLLRQEEMHPFQCIAIKDWRDIRNSAEYRCSGDVQGLGVKCKHFELGTFPYVHFTAPIRRFVDIIVHRLLHAFFENEKPPYSQLEIHDSCRHLNDCETRAKHYQRHCQSLIMAQNLQKSPIVVNGFVDECNEKGLTLIIPGCDFLNRHCKQIKINLLGVSERLVFEPDKDKFNSPAQRKFMTLKWKKRIYSARKKMPYPKNAFEGYTVKKKGAFQKLDPNQKTDFKQTQTWVKLLKSVILESDIRWGQSIDDLELGERLSKSFLWSSLDTENDINSEVVDQTRKYSNNADKLMITEQFCKFSMAFHRGQVVTVQMASEMQKGMLTPYIQVLVLTHGIKLCIEHMKDPVGCLERFSTDSTKQKYDDSEHYKQIWLPILAMENAINVVREDSITINDIFVNFSNTEGFFTLRADFCYERHIDMSFRFTTVHANEEDDEDKSVTISSDYVCIKCVVSSESNIQMDVRKHTPPSAYYILVVHGKIKKITRHNRDTTNETIKVCFDIIDNSKFILPTKARCSVELMQKPDINKRIDIAIQEMHRSTRLAKAIALNRKIPQLNKEYLKLVSKFKDDIDIGLPKNNEQQKKAIKHALTSTLTLIHGPPGTGKTNVGIKLICLFAEINQKMEERLDESVRRKKIVYCGPSNKSVDLVADRLLKLNHPSGPRGARLYGSSIEGLDYPIPGRIQATRGSGDCKSSDSLKPICIHHLIRQKGKPYAEEIQELYKQLTTTEFEITKELNVSEMQHRFPRELKSTGQKTETRKFVDLTKHKKYVEVLHTATIEELKHYDVIFCTTAMATNQKLLSALEGDIFQLIIDECGMCTEPESVATIIATKAEQVVLIGDHKQLQPVVVCPQAEKLGLQRSLFERYKSDANVCPLEVQYRMHPSICEFPSHRFYNGKLTTDSKSTSYIEKSPLKTWIYPERRFVFCHVFGEEEVLPVKTEEGNEMSRCNMEEVKQVMKIYNYLKNDEKIFQKHGKEGKMSLNIMSQYNAQCAAVRQKLSKHDLENVSVNTVVSSQGGEWDYVIFSLVRSLPDFRIEKYPTRGWCAKNLGFITDVHQINVALTRARKGLFIIGNKNLLRCDDNWAELLITYDRIGCLLNASAFPFVRKNDPPPKRQKKEPSQTDEDGFETVSYRK